MISFLSEKLFLYCKCEHFSLSLLIHRAAAMYAPTPQSVERSWNTQTVKRRSLSPPPTATATTTSLSNGRHDDDPSEVEPPKKKAYTQPKGVKRLANQKFVPPTTATSSSDVCYYCGKKVYLMERMSANGFFFHRTCFRCTHCNCQLKIGGYSLSKGEKCETLIPPFPFHLHVPFQFHDPLVPLVPFPFHLHVPFHSPSLPLSPLVQLVTGGSFSALLTTVSCFCRTPRQSITPGRGRGGGIGRGRTRTRSRWKFRNLRRP